MSMRTQENHYGLKSQVRKMRFVTGEVAIEVEFFREGDLKISRLRADNQQSYVIIPVEILDGVLAYVNSGGVYDQ